MITPRDPLVARPAKPIPERANDLSQLAAQVEAIRREATALVAGLTDEQFNWRPDPERWSIAQCLHHLVVSADGLLAGQRAAISRARERALVSAGPYRHGRIGSMIAVSIEPPITRRFKTKRSLLPDARHSIDVLLPEFEQRQLMILDVLESAHGLDLGRIRLPLPGVPLLRLTLGQSFAFMLGHERRHLWQAREVREHELFPG